MNPDIRQKCNLEKNDKKKNCLFISVLPMMHKNTPDEFTSMVLSSQSAMCINQAFQNHALIKKPR